MNYENKYYYSLLFIDIINKIQLRYISNIIITNSYYFGNQEYQLPIDLYNYINIDNKNNKTSYIITEINTLIKKYITNIDYNNEFF